MTKFLQGYRSIGACVYGQCNLLGAYSIQNACSCAAYLLSLRTLLHFINLPKRRRTVTVKGEWPWRQQRKSMINGGQDLRLSRVSSTSICTLFQHYTQCMLYTALWSTALNDVNYQHFQHGDGWEKIACSACLGRHVRLRGSSPSLSSFRSALLSVV